MPRDVTSLYDLCKDEITQLLKSTYWNIYCGNENPFSAIPTSLIEDLIVHVTRFSVIAPLRSSDLRPLLFTKRVKHFELEDVDLHALDLEYILTDLQLSCKSLVSIKIKNVFMTYTYRMDMKTYCLESLLLEAENLESLESCLEFNLNVLHNAKHLKRLVLHFPVENNLYDFLDIDDSNMDGIMVPHHSLQVLHILEDVKHPVKFLDVSVILRYCTELIEINCDVSKSLEYLHSEKVYNGTLATFYKLQKCCLGSIYLDVDEASVSSTGIYITSLTCPYLEEVDVLVKDYEAIHALSDFRNIKSLLIQWEPLQSGDYYSGVHKLIEKPEFGQKLRCLHILHFSRVDFSLMAEACPNLEELRVEFTTEKNRTSFPPTSFQKLTKLHLETLHGLGCSESTLIGILSHAVNLKYLTLNGGRRLTDSVLERILTTNKLSNVKELHIYRCSLLNDGLRILAANLTALEHFEMNLPDLPLEEAAMIVHSINPFVIMTEVSDA